MTPKAIVFDLDGTAFPNGREGMPSERLVQAVQKASAKLHVFVATGRPVVHALHVIQALKLRDPCVIAGGAIIIDPSGKILRESRLTQSQLSAVREVLMPFPYTIGRDNQLRDERKTAAELELKGEASILFIPGVEAEDLTTLIQQLSKIPGIVATSARAWSGGHVINITPADGSKEHGVGHVLNQLGIKKEQAVGVGDGDNDIHLFAAVGHRIAMGNASEQLKSVADEIAPSVEEDGLAWVIERYTD